MYFYFTHFLHQHPLNCHPFTIFCHVSEFQDMSAEEMRFEAYQCKAQGSMEPYVGLCLLRHSITVLHLQRFLFGSFFHPEMPVFRFYPGFLLFASENFPTFFLLKNTYRLCLFLSRLHFVQP